MGERDCFKSRTYDTQGTDLLARTAGHDRCCAAMTLSPSAAVRIGLPDGGTLRTDCHTEPAADEVCASVEQVAARYAHLRQPIGVMTFRYASLTPFDTDRPGCRFDARAGASNSSQGRIGAPPSSAARKTRRQKVAAKFQRTKYQRWHGHR
jgi:hypothetical protein